MNDIEKALKEVKKEVSSDGTTKFLFELEDENLIFL